MFFFQYFRYRFNIANITIKDQLGVIMYLT